MSCSRRDANFANRPVADLSRLVRRQYVARIMTSAPVAKPGYLQAIQSSGVLTALADFDPHVAGTPPLGLDLPSSDIDVLCFAPDSAAFTEAVWNCFSPLPSFEIHQWTSARRAVIASFVAEGWPFEIFAEARPVAEQAGWRHFVVEQRLLSLGGARLRSTVMALRHGGAKTEPAFAAALRLQGNPYEAMLDIAGEDDDGLLRLLEHAGYLLC